MAVARVEHARAWLRLVRAPRVGGTLARRLLEVFTDLPTALAASAASWQRHGLSAAAYAALRAPAAEQIEQDLAWLQDPQHHLLTLADADYPALLREAPNPPPALFVVGQPALLWSAQVAVVGSRNPSEGGRDNARAFAGALSACGLTITSGLAEGIDGAAHQAALDRGGATIAVVGTGPDLVYPRRHRALAAAIAEHGAVVSEFAPGTPAQREHFPRRNRIVAGLSLGTLVIEAALQSGALISARLASEAGREVMALPGSIHNPLARGCHRLIRDGAALIETVDEVLELLRTPAQALGARLRQRLDTDAAAAAESAQSATGADPQALRVLQALGHDPQPLDRLACHTGLTIAALSSILLQLELEGRVSVAHGRYLRSGS